MRQTLAVTRQSLAEAMSGRAFPVAFLAAIGLVVLWGWNVGETIFETITWPVTHLVAGIVLSERAIVIPWLVIALFAGELVWKDRETGAAQIADAAPVRTSVVLLGRFLALVALIALFQLAFMIGGILLQVLHGYYDFEPGLYLRILFGWNLVEYVLLAAFAMTVHVLVNHKYVGHVRRAAGDRLQLRRVVRNPPPAHLQRRPEAHVLGDERLRPVRHAVRLVQALLGGVGDAARAS